VMPGKFSVTLSEMIDGKITQIAGPREFSVVVEGTSEMPESDRAALVEFQTKVQRLQRAVTGAVRSAEELRQRMTLVDRALRETPQAGGQLTEQALAIEKRDNEILRALRGDSVLRGLNYNTAPSILERAGKIVNDQRMSTARPTPSQNEVYSIAAAEFTEQLSRLRTLIDVDLVKLEKDMESAGAPWTPGHLPQWSDK
jgi:hypothetical protein